ncbi:hypothetical protein QEH52_15230 [Coraliomargarita sp. SDUM461003]|uniref:DUF4380 domain-containing protein n=1 Tax=Thalassobacterium maritimum TaxID=3041265 RepID=A0ABU1AXI6_9BACT|nr:hypothetical protein [Coraliomargarita sp. SDUM461003]MDQ8208879.1 hypothetical protein [Coraliomargarita sp. SDUM461003]
MYKHLGPVETIDNGVVTLGVALDVGRIVSFKQHDADDWIVVFDQASIPSWHWHPWGGDRMWPTAQGLNLQIYNNDGFDPVIDGAPWELISKTASSLVMRSGISPQLGLQVTHKIELLAESSEVLHSYRVERLAESVYPVHVWAVTGVRGGDYILMESVAPAKTHKYRKPYRRWPAEYPAAPVVKSLEDSQVLKFEWARDEQQKIGSYGHWIAMVDAEQAFCQYIQFQPNELYLERSNLQAYVNTERSTYEVETLSPTWPLRIGESREWCVRWQLVDLPAQAQSAEAVAQFLAEHL